MKSKENITLTVDCVVFDKQDRLLLIQRGNPPFKGQYALPGGMVDYGETTKQAAIRELEEETGVRISSLRLIGVYSEPDRDPRGHTVSVAYLAEFPENAHIQAGDDASSVRLEDSWDEKDLAFDHAKIISDALNLREEN